MVSVANCEEYWLASVHSHALIIEACYAMIKNPCFVEKWSLCWWPVKDFPAWGSILHSFRGIPIMGVTYSPVSKLAVAVVESFFSLHMSGEWAILGVWTLFSYSIFLALLIIDAIIHLCVLTDLVELSILNFHIFSVLCILHVLFSDSHCKIHACFLRVPHMCRYYCTTESLWQSYFDIWSDLQVPLALNSHRNKHGGQHLSSGNFQGVNVWWRPI